MTQEYHVYVQIDLLTYEGVKVDLSEFEGRFYSMELNKYLVYI